MKVIFLDIDGVLNSSDWYARRPKSPKTTFGRKRNEFDPDCVQRLNKILGETGAVIVVSSSWRINHTLSELREHFSHAGLGNFDVVDTTGPHKGTRGSQIKQWILENDGYFNIDKFIILDDDSDMDDLTTSLVKTDFFKGGLLDSHVEVVIRMLNANE